MPRKRMLALLLALLIALPPLTVDAYAAEYTFERGTLTITADFDPAAFAQKDLVTAVEIGAGVTDLYEWNPFAGYSALKSITVAEGNTAFSGAGGVLFTRDGKTLVSYPAAKADSFYILPSTVEILARKSFVRTAGLDLYSRSGNSAKIGAGSTTFKRNAFPGSPVTVYQNYVEVTGVELDKAALELEPGGTAGLSASVLPGEEAGDVVRAVTWTSSDEGVATVDQNGVVTAVAEGEAAITVTTADQGKTAVCTVNVYAPAEAITLNKYEMELTFTRSESETLTAAVHPADANQTVTWESSDASVARVDERGVVTAITPGSAEITATSVSNTAVKSEKCVVTVKQPAQGVTLNETELTLSLTEEDIPDEFDLVATVTPSDTTDPIVWTISDASGENVISLTRTREEVSDDGEAMLSEYAVQALRSGTATVTVASGAYSDSCAVTVLVPAESISLDETDVELEVNESVTLTAAVRPENTYNKQVTWCQSDEEAPFLTLEDNGDGTATITADDVGEADITVTTADGSHLSATCHIKAVPISVKGVSLDPAEWTMTIGEPKELTAAITPADAANQALIWTSSDERVAAVTDRGLACLVTAVGPGIAYITASTTDGSVASNACAVTVPVAVTGIEMEVDGETTLDPEDVIVLVARAKPDDAANTRVYFLLSDEDFDGWDDVSENNGEDYGYLRITAPEPGSGDVEALTVTAKTSDGGFSASRTLTFRPSVSSVTLDETGITLEPGETADLTATVLPAGANQRLTWSSSDESAATVSQSGVVTAVADGSASVTATAKNGAFAACDVTVRTSVQSVIITDRAGGDTPLTGFTLYLAEAADHTRQLYARVTPSDAADPSVRWESDDPAVASVDSESGLVTAAGVGGATITVTTEDGGFAASCTVTVEQAEISFYHGGEKITGDSLTLTLMPQDDTESLRVEPSGTLSDLTLTPDGGAYAVTQTVAGDTLSFASVKNGEYTLHITREGGNGYGAVDRTIVVRSAAVPITGISLDDSVNTDGTALTASLDTDTKTIFITGYVPGDVDAGDIDLTGKLKPVLALTQYTAQNPAYSPLRTAYEFTGGLTDTLTASLGGKSVAYTVDKSGVTQLPENLDVEVTAELDTSQLTGTSISAVTSGAMENAIKAAAVQPILTAVNTLMADVSSVGRIEMNVKLNDIQTAGNAVGTDEEGNEQIERILSLNIEPEYKVYGADEALITEGTLHALSAPITFTVRLGIMPTYILHIHQNADGSTTTEQLEIMSAVYETDANGDTMYTVTWQQSTFSEVQFIVDGRRGAITFLHDGKSETIPYDALALGDPLPAAARAGGTFAGWTVEADGKTVAAGARVLTGALLSAISKDKSATATPQFTMASGTGVSSGANSGAAPQSARTDRDSSGSDSGYAAESGGRSGSASRGSGTAAGAKTATETSADGSAVTTVTNADGSLRSASVTVSRAAAAGGPVILPVTLAPASGAAQAAPVRIELPDSAAGRVRIVIPTAGANSGTVAVLVREDGTQAIIKDCVVTGDGVAFGLDGSAEVRIVDNSKTFDDVSGTYWGQDAISFVAAREIYAGVGGGRFAPEDSMSRGMMAQVLYNFDRQAGKDAPEGAFGDLSPDDWYYTAANWSAKEGVFSGSGGAFQGERPISRQELVTCLYNYAKSRGYQTGGGADWDGFPDSGQVRPYAGEAMRWAVGNGLVSGMDGRLNPDGPATRAQVASIMMRLCQRVVR